MTITPLLNKSKSRKGHTITNTQALDKLAKQIRSRYDATTQLVKSAKDKSREAVAEAILCGTALNEAKAIVSHGAWEKWLARHCKGVHENTARNYMRLAKAQHVVDLNRPESLRQAYIAVGILSDSITETSGTQSPAPMLTLPTSNTAQTTATQPGKNAQDEAAPSVVRLPITTPAQLIEALEGLTSRLIIDCNNYIQSKRLTSKQVESATIKPLQAFFDGL